MVHCPTTQDPGPSPPQVILVPQTYFINHTFSGSGQEVTASSSSFRGQLCKLHHYQHKLPVMVLAHVSAPLYLKSMGSLVCPIFSGQDIASL